MISEDRNRRQTCSRDHARESVIVASKINRQWIDMGRVEIREGSVSQVPFAQDMFDLVTAVETHFWWPDLPGDMREVLRCLKPGGTLIVIAEGNLQAENRRMYRMPARVSNLPAFET